MIPDYFAKQWRSPKYWELAVVSPIATTIAQHTTCCVNKVSTESDTINTFNDAQWNRNNALGKMHLNEQIGAKCVQPCNYNVASKDS